MTGLAVRLSKFLKHHGMWPAGQHMCSPQLREAAYRPMVRSALLVVYTSLLSVLAGIFLVDSLAVVVKIDAFFSRFSAWRIEKKMLFRDCFGSSWTKKVDSQGSQNKSVPSSNQTSSIIHFCRIWMSTFFQCLLPGNLGFLKAQMSKTKRPNIWRKQNRKHLSVRFGRGSKFSIYLPKTEWTSDSFKVGSFTLNHPVGESI